MNKAFKTMVLLVLLAGLAMPADACWDCFGDSCLRVSPAYGSRSCSEELVGRLRCSFSVAGICLGEYVTFYIRICTPSPSPCASQPR